MFTGIVQEVGEVQERDPREGSVEFRIRAPGLAGELAAGESVSVDGVCLTAAETAADGFRVEAVETTLARSTLAQWSPGRRVNLERALTLADRLGGHLVQGHVDGVGRIDEVARAGDTVRVRIELPEEVRRVTVPRGSLAVDGVSLTVAELEGSVAEVAIIPYTWSHTTLDRLVPAEKVNLEADLIGKYVARLSQPYRRGPVGRSGEEANASPPEA